MVIYYYQDSTQTAEIKYSIANKKKKKVAAEFFTIQSSLKKD